MRHQWNQTRQRQWQDKHRITWRISNIDTYIHTYIQQENGSTHTSIVSIYINCLVSDYTLSYLNLYVNQLESMATIESQNDRQTEQLANKVLRLKNVSVLNIKNSYDFLLGLNLIQKNMNSICTDRYRYWQRSKRTQSVSRFDGKIIEIVTFSICQLIYTYSSSSVLISIQHAVSSAEALVIWQLWWIVAEMIGVSWYM